MVAGGLYVIAVIRAYNDQRTRMAACLMKNQKLSDFKSRNKAVEN